jgi:nucleoside-diphosphate-sugar epimerase
MNGSYGTLPGTIRSSTMHVLLTGATGLLGQGVLHECLQAHDLRHVTALGRRETGVAHPRLREIVLPDFADAASVSQRLPASTARAHHPSARPPPNTARSRWH